MTLQTLLAGECPAPLAGLSVTGLTLDSRRVQPGWAFAAVAGGSGHGLQHAADALDRGAAVVLWDDAGAHDVPEPMRSVAVPGLRRRLGELADRFYGQPSAALTVAAVTGTNGKSTVAWLVAGAARCLGVDCAYVGTLGSGRPGRLEPAELTTPDVVRMHALLDEFRTAGIELVALEASSHALDQGRLDGVRIPVTAFLNLSRDHLDYHGTLEAYGAAKARLLERRDVRARVINAEDAFGRRLLETWRAVPGTVCVSLRPSRCDGSGVALLGEARTAGTGMAVTVSGPFGSAVIETPLIGTFNAENLLLAFAVLLQCGLEPMDAARALCALPGPPGRLERVAGPADRPAVFVDYAHTPGALQRVLVALRPLAQTQLVCVFGCGGNRDRGKRGPMGAVAVALADRVVLTSDNPRREAPEAIIADIVAGIPDAERFKVTVEVDRRRAIQQAVGGSGRGDVVLIAGRGHETHQQWAAHREPLSDADVARECLGRAA